MMGPKINVSLYMKHISVADKKQPTPRVLRRTVQSEGSVEEFGVGLSTLWDISSSFKHASKVGYTAAQELVLLALVLCKWLISIFSPLLATSNKGLMNEREIFPRILVEYLDG